MLTPTDCDELWGGTPSPAPRGLSTQHGGSGKGPSRSTIEPSLELLGLGVPDRAAVKVPPSPHRRPCPGERAFPGNDSDLARGCGADVPAKEPH